MLPPGRPHSKKKRRRGPVLIPLRQALINLSKTSLKGQLEGQFLNLEVDHDAAHLYQSCDIGDPHPSTINPQLTVYERRALRWPSLLQLPLVDAFFAAHALGCLTAVAPGGEELSTDAFWRYCVDMLPGFAHLYACYLHYRSKGWFVRNGLDFGAHYVIYRAHRSEVHAEHTVIVRTAMPNSGNSLEWREVSITNRVNVQVKKRLLIVSILEPPAPDYSSPACLTHMAIDERKVVRWTAPDGTMQLPEEPQH